MSFFYCKVESQSKLREIFYEKMSSEFGIRTTSELVLDIGDGNGHVGRKLDEFE